MNTPFKLTGVTGAIKQRQKVEQTIARAVVDALLAAGFLLGVNDGEELVVHHTRDRKDILAALFNTDEDYLYVYKDEDKDDPTNVLYDPRPDYWVRFVYGNDGWDVVCDNSVALEPWIGEGTAVDKLIEKYSG